MPQLKKIAAAALTACFAAWSIPAHAAQPEAKAKPKRNLIVFVADGMRYGSINLNDAPTMFALRELGVNFVNGHSLFPTFTTPNASAIATSHYLGDTGDFSNTIYSGYPVYDTGNFGNSIGTVTPFVENNQILGDLDSHFGGNYLNEETLLELARLNGYNTAAVGKVGPVGIMDVSQLNPVNGSFATPQTVFIDDATGGSAGIPLPAAIASALTAAGLPTVAPNRTNGCASTAQCSNGFSGNNMNPGTTSPNLVQQQYFVDSLTKAILPTFAANDKPFAAVFWSRDPDGTQHNQGDSLNKLSPGINGPTSKAAVKNADNNLLQILEYVYSNPELAANTDIFLTSDHGFATISKHEVDAKGTPTKSFAAKQIYKDITGRQEVNTGFLPVGFLAIDLGHYLHLPIFDPDSQIAGSNGVKSYEPVNVFIPQQSATVRQHPASGDALLGGTSSIKESPDAQVVIAANGGSDLIYVPSQDTNLVHEIVSFLASADYVGAVFVDDAFGPINGALPLSSINLVGDAKTPRPTIAVSFKTFYLDPTDLQTAVQIADSGLQEGQGMHGSLGRDNTFNNMAAFGPDFKAFYVDQAPVSNADIAMTMAHIVGLELEHNGNLRGRVIREALKGGPKTVDFEQHQIISGETHGSYSTILHYQTVGKQLYFDDACEITPYSSEAAKDCRQ